jgi:hypothetical protein
MSIRERFRCEFALGEALRDTFFFEADVSEN